MIKGSIIVKGEISQIEFLNAVLLFVCLFVHLSGPNDVTRIEVRGVSGSRGAV